MAQHEYNRFEKKYYQGDVAQRPYCSCGWIGKWTEPRRGINEARELSDEQFMTHLELVNSVHSRSEP